MNRKDVGVFQKKDGYWGYRFRIVVDGKVIYRLKYRDCYGNKFHNKTEAKNAREAAIHEARTEQQRKRTVTRKTFSEVYKEYCDYGKVGKAYRTLIKQDSIWKNHLSKKWGSRYIDEVSPAEIYDYLCELYYEKEYAYRYVESFLKMFYLLFGQAYSRNHLSVDVYNRFCVNKGIKITQDRKLS